MAITWEPNALEWAQLDAQIDASKRQSKAAMAGVKASKEAVKAQLKIAKMNLDFEYEQMKKIGIPTMEANRWYQQQQVRLADEAHKLAKAELGLEYAKYSASLSGPANYAQAWNFARNAQNVGAPEFLKALEQNTGLQAGFAGQYAMPDRETPASIAAKMGYGTGADKAAASAAEKQFQEARDAAWNIFSRSGASYAPGSIESLDQGELEGLVSLGGDVGADVPRWLRDYQRSRMGTENPLLA